MNQPITTDVEPTDVEPQEDDRNPPDSRKLPEEGFVRVWQIIGDRKKGIPAVIPVGKTNWWEGVKEGRYPKGIKILGSKVTVWRVEDIRQLIEELQAA